MALTLCQGAHEGPQVVGLLQNALADLHDVGEVSMDLRKKLPPDDSLSEEQPMKRVGVVRVLLGKSLETLLCSIRPSRIGNVGCRSLTGGS